MEGLPKLGPAWQTMIVSDIAIFVLEGDAKLQLTNWQTMTHTTYVHNNFLNLHHRVSEIHVLNRK